MRHDLPGGGERLYAEGRGIAHVFVNGREIVAADQLTGELPADTAAVGRRHRHGHGAW